MIIEKSDLQAAPPEMDDWDVDYLHGATDAWDMGFYGDGVKIAVIDTGMDMAHPDLYGQQARYSSGAYAGWPIAFEASAASAWANYDIGGWVADTSYMAVEDAAMSSSTALLLCVRDPDGKRILPHRLPHRCEPGLPDGILCRGASDRLDDIRASTTRSMSM